MSVVTYRISAMSLIQPAGASGLSDLEFRVLEFEKSWWRYAGAKESAIKELFDLMLKTCDKCLIWGGNYFADMLPATMGWLYWDKGQKGLSMSDGELAWTVNVTVFPEPDVPTYAPAIPVDVLPNKFIVFEATVAEPKLAGKVTGTIASFTHPPLSSK